ncbi:phosphotyrosine-specific ptp2-like protein [Coemansia thaxteri]|nr:phosphotyrosine-specific ptp2-like protein [Coemansia thaxteri]KAJ2471233.1 phosphotyrosine-specific ptp2-like protein [Coemansia sp. RSA 2322]
MKPLPPAPPAPLPPSHKIVSPQPSAGSPGGSALFFKPKPTPASAPAPPAAHAPAAASSIAQRRLLQRKPAGLHLDTSAAPLSASPSLFPPPTPAAVPGAAHHLPALSGSADTPDALKLFQSAIDASSSASFTLRPALGKQPLQRRSAGPSASSLKVAGLNYLRPDELATKLAAGEKRGLVVDMRKSVEYMASRLVSAIGMTVPTTLVKRSTFTIERLLAMLHSPEQQKQAVARWKQSPWVVLYGEGAPEETASDESPLVLLAKKFMNEAPPSCRIYVLEGGFRDFFSRYAKLCELSSANTPSGGSASKHAASNASASAAPRRTVEFDHPLLRKMRQTPGGAFDPNEVLCMRMPPELVSAEKPPLSPSSLLSHSLSLADARLSLLPLYLRQVVDRELGPALLLQLFKCIDVSENRRMMAMIGSSGAVTEFNQYTISAGLELGSKNRYTNIYPFDSNRVRLQSDNRSPPPLPSASTAAATTTTKARSPVSNLNKPLPPLPFAMMPAATGSARIAGDGLAAHPGCDYINASFLGYFGGPVYIAAQGPLPDTSNDFWNMVWEQEARVVVMLTRNTESGRAKCHQYWPDAVGQAKRYGEIVIEWEAEAHHPDDPGIVSRRLKLSRSTAGGPSRIVTHLQYVGWPDLGVPDTPLGVLRLRQLARLAQQSEPDVETSLSPSLTLDGRVPMVVHCSAGCGRTGAFCAIDTLLAISQQQQQPNLSATNHSLDVDGDISMADDGKSEEAQQQQQQGIRQLLGGWREIPPREFHDNLVFMVVSRFREQRMSSVQTGKQFAFCHEALVWSLLGMGPRPLERIIDRRLVAEWNRANHPMLSPADCVDVTYLMRGRQEMVSAMGDRPPLAEDAAAAAALESTGCGGGGCMPGGGVVSRASVDVGGSPSLMSVMASPMVKRSNTVGVGRRGLFGSIFRSSPSASATTAASSGNVTGDKPAATFTSRDNVATDEDSSPSLSVGVVGREKDLVSSVVNAKEWASTPLALLSRVAEEDDETSRTVTKSGGGDHTCLDEAMEPSKHSMQPAATAHTPAARMVLHTCGSEASAAVQNQQDVAGDYFGAVQADDEEQQQQPSMAAEWRLLGGGSGGVAAGNSRSGNTPVGSPSAYAGSTSLASPRVK